MGDFGIKVSQQGHSVLTANPEELVFSSKYKTLRIKSRGTGSISSATSGGLVTIAHNLGYVPAFLVHLDPGALGQYYIAPWKPSTTQLISAYADSTNLYIKSVSTTTTDTYYPSSNVNESMAEEIEGAGGYHTGSWDIGNDADGDYRYGAIRFTGIDLDKDESFTSATLNLYISLRDGSGEVKMTVWGIDDDNTATFNTSTAATARDKTTASDNYAATLSLNDSWGVDVTDQVAEIIARAGWTNNNALGIMFWDNGTPAGNQYKSSDYTNTNLEIVKTIPTTANYTYTIFLNQIA